MNTRSAKQKGKNLEKAIRDRLLAEFSELTADDIRCTIGSETGADIKFSKKAKKILPYAFECKARATIGVYNWLEQAKSHVAEGQLEPVVICKANRKPPIVVLSLDHFLQLLKKEK